MTTTRSGFSSKSLVAITSAPQTFGTARTSIIASSSTKSSFLAVWRPMNGLPAASMPVCMKKLKLSWKSSGVSPYSRCGSAWISWQLVWVRRP